ncbi:MAG: efflux RND transporter periplasmic adaptor subunit, partial [Verrucomicrobiota bacterium]
MKKIIGVFIVVSLALVLTYAVWKALSEKNRKDVASSIESIQKKEGVPVTVIKPVMTNLALSLRLDAVIEPEERARVMSEIAGRIRNITVDEGQRVSSGDVLVELYDEAYRAGKEAAEAEYNDARTNLTRIATLLRKGAISRSEYDAASARLERARSALVAAEDELDDCSVDSPVNGTVSRRHVDPGMVTAAGTLLVEIVNTSRLKAEMMVPESMVPELEAGLPAVVHVHALGSQPIKTTVERINPELNERGRRLKAISYLDFAGESVKPGMFAAAEVQYATKTNTLVVPGGIIINRSGQEGVYVADKDTARFVEIETGIVSDGLVEIVEGLSGDEQVIAGGSKRVADGSAI